MGGCRLAALSRLSQTSQRLRTQCGSTKGSDSRAMANRGASGWIGLVMTLSVQAVDPAYPLLAYAPRLREGCKDLRPLRTFISTVACTLRRAAEFRHARCRAESVWRALRRSQSIGGSAALQSFVVGVSIECSFRA